MSVILVVDDNANNLYLARFLLEKAGHQVAEAHNGVEAVQAVAQDTYDLILMDIQMPILDGLSAARQIKEQPDAPLIVALTAKAMMGDKDAILASGCDGYIKKPLIPDTFVEQVQCCLTKKCL